MALGCSIPAQALDLFAHHEVTVQLATKDGAPMGDAEVRVFAPGEASKPALTGRTDASGKFAFEADRDGFWSAEARNGDEVARVSIRVGGQDSARQAPQEPLSAYWLFGGLGILLVLAFGYRIMRIRARRRG